MLGNRYYAISIPGLERVCWTEAQDRLENAVFNDEQKGRFSFTYNGDPASLLRLRSVEDIYIFIEVFGGLSRSRNSLGDIFRRVKSCDLQTALNLHKQAHGGKGKKRLTFKVVSTMTGRHNFRRVDVQTAVESSLMEKYHWRIESEFPTLEFRIDLEEDKALFGLRLTDERTRRKAYKMAHIPGSLRPTVAYCMALLSEPKPGDVFVDPMCGAGTIAIERAFAGSCHRIIGGDVKESIVRSARNNVNESRRSVELMVWDVSSLPLNDYSVDKLVCNMPFGKQSGSHLENQHLYSTFFKEMVRITKPGGRAILLTTETALLKGLISKYSSLKLKRVLKIDLLGLKAFIYVIDFR